MLLVMPGFMGLCPQLASGGFPAASPLPHRLPYNDLLRVFGPVRLHTVPGLFQVLQDGIQNLSEHTMPTSYSYFTSLVPNC